MPKLLLAAVLLCLGFPAPAQERPVLTVLDFESDNLSRSEMRTIISLLSSALFRTGRYTVIDVAQRDTILKELEFSTSDCADAACQLRIGELLSANLIVVGNVQKIGSRHVLTAKVLEIGTGRTVSAADGIYSSLDDLLDGIPPLSSSLAGVEPTGSTAVAASRPSADTAPIRVALIAPLTGAVPTFGVSTRDGAMLAIEDWNRKGGVLGRRIQLVVEDGQCSAGPAAAAAKRIIEQEKIRFIIGEVCSRASIPVSDLAQAAKVIQITGASTNPAVTVDAQGKTKDYVFRACFIDTFQGLVGARFAAGSLKARKAFIMVDQANDYVNGLAEVFETEFKKAGGAIVGKESYIATDTDFSAILAKIRSAKPDIVYLPDYYQVVNLATRQAKEKGITVPFMGGDGWDSSDLDLKATEGSYFTNHFHPGDTRPEVVSFVKAFGATYRDQRGAPRVPDSLAALAYEATDVLLQAIAAAGSDNTTSVKEALESTTFRSVSGELRFNAQHNPTKTAIVMAVRGGKVSFHSAVSP
jgi:branched-chain amino acid transport system substrate-binding protein